MTEVYNNLFTSILKAESAEEVSDLVGPVNAMAELTAEQKDQLIALGVLVLTNLSYGKIVDDRYEKISDLRSIIQNLAEIKLHQLTYR